MKNTFLVLFTLSIPLLSKVEVLDRIAVIVDDGVVMESQITKNYEAVVQRYDEQNIPKPPVSELKTQITEKLIIEELQLQLADRAGVRISDSELNQTFIRLASNNGMELQEFINYIESTGGSYEEVREDVRKEMIIQRVQRGRVNSEIDITEQEFEAFLATDESIKALQPELLVKQILVETNDIALKALERITNGENFSDIAKDISIARNASSGGIIDWRKPSDMPELFANALANKKVGYISEPLQSGAGFHILKLENKRGELVQYEDQWWSRHILMIPSAIRDDETTIKELSEIRDRILKGEDFAILAEEFSEDPGSSKLGGDLDWLGMGVLDENFEKTMLATAIGELSEVFESQFGYHFLEVLGRRNHDMTDELINDRAYNVLFERKFDEVLENTLRSMRAEAFVEFKDLD